MECFVGWEGGFFLWCACLYSKFMVGMSFLTSYLDRLDELFGEGPKVACWWEGM